MSGETNSAKEQMEKLDKVLDEYESQCGLPYVEWNGNEDEFREYLSMPREALEKLTPHDCTQIAYRLGQFAFHLQKQVNRENARVVWAKQRLMELVGQESEQFDKYTKFEVKTALIVKANAHAQALQRIWTYAEQRSTRLTFLSSSLKHLSDILLYNAKNVGSNKND